ncbi:14138_t:CDS:2 [Funneliformis geosporum]|nr:14138_t:CDS:2 [Funneliformis geosporum]
MKGYEELMLNFFFTVEKNDQYEYVKNGNKISINPNSSSWFFEELLEKGYNKRNIILEKSFRLGHNNTGYVDIAIERDGQIYYMIEVKIPREDKQFNIRTREENIIKFEGLKFQFLEDIDTYESFMKRLYDLYKEGIKEYLQKEIVDYSDYEVLTLLNSKKDQKILEMIDDLRLKKDNTFAFLEVFDNKTFKDNCLIVKEIVSLLANFKFRYSDKSKSLGEFFEDLLNTSLKQEAGQFFTPPPLIDFMICSLPIKEIIKQNIQQNKNELLPLFIDYACAKDYVFGIEKDYRLAKTTKISLFLNGDGDAQILHADAINKFSCEEFSKSALFSNESRNEKFDFVVSNPPYSVQGYMKNFRKNNIFKGDGTFELLEEINEKDARIEIMFIERTYQLLKKNKFAAIILPQSFLSQEKYAKTRKKKSQISKYANKDSNYQIFLINSPKMFLAAKDTKQTLKKEREFLGYEFSQSRNKSGIKISNNNNLVEKYSNQVRNFFLDKGEPYSDDNSRATLISEIILKDEKENYVIYPRYKKPDSNKKGFYLKDIPCYINQ